MASTSFILFLVVSHMTVSSTMLVLNKAVLKLIPAATTVLLFQVGSSAILLYGLGKMNVIRVDPFELTTARAFFWNAVAFMILLFTNAKALEAANVEAVIVFRTLSIFVTAYGDFRLLQARALSMEAIGALCLVVLGAIGFVLSDKGFVISNMFWVFIYGCANAAYPLVTKMVIRSNDMTSWGRTYYNNLMTFLVFLPGVFVLGEHRTIFNLEKEGGLNIQALTLLFLSCVWGTAISFLGFFCLEYVTATTFNVMGNANKILTLVVNGLLWDQHATLQANLCLAVSLIGAGLYGEAKRRQGNTPPPQVGSGRDDGKQREHNGTGEHKDPESQLHPDRHNSK
mmetsp:Transcript_48685/g.152835  ORF Transcript_48685/g.152835 Transcript_48685/m.152835 type:complete len:341 (-) Transcript_48685:42-1064(-)